MTTNLHADVARILRSPWTILLGAGAGALLGMGNPILAMRLAPLGDIYLTLLTMCVIPIMMTAVISSFGRLLSTQQAGKYLMRIGSVFVCGIILTTAVGLMVGVLGEPGAGLTPEIRATLGAVLQQAEINPTARIGRAHV